MYVWETQVLCNLYYWQQSFMRWRKQLTVLLHGDRLFVVYILHSVAANRRFCKKKWPVFLQNSVVAAVSVKRVLPFWVCHHNVSAVAVQRRAEMTVHLECL